MRSATLMHQLASSGDCSVAHSFKVVRVHFDPHHGVPVRFNQQEGTHASKRFGQGYRGATMQQASRLMRARIHRHRCAQAAFVICVETDPQVRHHRVGYEGVGAIGVLLRIHVVRPKVAAIFARMDKGRILLVEDEASIRSALRMNFELEGYSVTTATTGPEGLERLRGARFDLVVMDVMLPGLDGHTVIETVRLEGDTTPVIFLTARDTPADRIRGLRIGDDHLGKPFELEELLLRVAKLIRKADAHTRDLPVRFEFDGNSIDLGSFQAKGYDGAERTLSQREAMLLRLLIERSGQVVSREEILQKVWGYNVFPTTRTVDNFIVAFRKYFEPDPRVPRHFHSIRGVGYKFIP